MEWKDFTEKYGSYSQDFNNQDFNERIRVGNLMTYEAMRELIRSKKHLQEAIKNINGRLKILSRELDKDLIDKKTNPN